MKEIKQIRIPIRDKSVKLDLPVKLDKIEIPEYIKQEQLRDQILFWWSLFLEMRKMYYETTPLRKIILEYIKAITSFLNISKIFLGK